jgi:transcriptional regulator with XRE-family HTH domain
MEARKLVGWNVRRLRVAISLTIEELADSASVGESYLSRLERGEENVGVVTLSRLARALKVELAEFFVKPAPGDKAPKPLSPGRRPSKIRPRKKIAR